MLQDITDYNLYHIFILFYIFFTLPLIIKSIKKTKNILQKNNDDDGESFWKKIESDAKNENIKENNKLIFDSQNFLFNFKSYNKILLFKNKIINPDDWTLIIKNRFNDSENIIYNMDEKIFFTIKEIVKSEYVFIDKNEINKKADLNG